MLQTPLDSITSLAQHQDIVKNNEKVVVVCGRMGPMCVPVYGIMDALKEKHLDIKFYDFEFDNPDAAVIRDLPECRLFRGLPFTIYYRDGKVVKATSSIQEARDVKSIIKEVYV